MSFLKFEKTADILWRFPEETVIKVNKSRYWKTTNSSNKQFVSEKISVAMGVWSGEPFFKYQKG